MADQNDNENFEQLKKLLALKRHESPPPGYFEQFSSRVIARIEAARPEPQGAWFQRVFGELFRSPALAGAYGIGALAVVVFGFALVPTGADNLPVSPAEQAAAFSMTPAPVPEALHSGQTAGSLAPVLAPDAAPVGLFPAGGFANPDSVGKEVMRENFRFPSVTNGQPQKP